MMAADNLSDVLSQLEQIDNKHTPKTLGVKWKADSGEAGEFVETRSRGGIVGYSKDVHKGEYPSQPICLHLLTTP